MTKEFALELIEQYQAIQKRNPPDSISWRIASNELRVLFAWMARQS